MNEPGQGGVGYSPQNRRYFSLTWDFQKIFYEENMLIY